MRVAFVDAHRHRWPVAVICRAIGLSERTYHARKSRPASARAARDEQLKADIGRVFAANYSCYGTRRMWIALRREDIEIGRCRVERLMADMGLRGVQRGKKRYTTVADADAARPPDLVCRQFAGERRNQLWLADITYCSTWEGWLYVSFICDAYSRMIVGWQIATHNAMAEALNGTFKAELVHLHGPWRTRAQVEKAIIDWIYWYNERLHGEIGDCPPAEYEHLWYTYNQPALTGTN